MGIVIIPGFSRPEFLQLCLEQIQKAHKSKNQRYLFALDHLFKRSDYLRVIDSFRKRGYNVLIQQREATTYGPAKQSYNLISAYRSVAERHNPSDGLIHMIEEDILISNDYFVWHEYAHNKVRDAFCAIATENHNERVETTESMTKIYTITGGFYQSLGVSFRGERLRWILSQITDEYFRDMVGYCQRRWPASKIGRFYCEQDGLIRRIQEASDYPVVFPHVPRAYHAGFYGKNRGQRITGTVAQKVEKLRAICFSPERMKNQSGKWWSDSVPVNLTNPKWWQDLDE